MEEFDDFITAEVRGVAQRRSPVTVANRSVLMQQIWVFHNQLADHIDIVAPDCIDELAGLDEPRPIWRSITPRESKLRISEPDFAKFRSPFWERG